jgi:hypothetical protein
MHQDEAPFRAELVAAFRRERQRSAVYGDARDCRTFVVIAQASRSCGADRNARLIHGPESAETIV